MSTSNLTKEIISKLKQEGIAEHFSSVEVHFMKGKNDGAHTVRYSFINGLDKNQIEAAKKALLDAAKVIGVNSISTEF